jgi:hypothetical protein
MKLQTKEVVLGINDTVDTVSPVKVKRRHSVRSKNDTTDVHGISDPTEHQTPNSPCGLGDNKNLMRYQRHRGHHVFGLADTADVTSLVLLIPRTSCCGLVDSLWGYGLDSSFCWISL